MEWSATVSGCEFLSSESESSPISFTRVAYPVSVRNMADDVTTAAADPDSQQRCSTGLVNEPSLGAVEAVVPVFAVWDTARSLAWYEGLGFRLNGASRVPPGRSVLSLVRGEHVELCLAEHDGDGWPNSLVRFTVDNLEPIAAEYGAQITEGVAGPELWLCDPDGNRLRVTAASAG